MKKTSFIYTTCLFLFATFSFLSSCKKNLLNEQEKITLENPEIIENPISYFSEKFLNDSNFVSFVKLGVTNNLRISRKLTQNNDATFSLKTGVDSSEIYTMAAEIATSYSILLLKNPAFASLSSAEKSQIITNITTTVSKVEFQTAYPDNELVQFEKEIKPEIYDNGYGVAVINKFSVDNISSGEFWSCTAGTLATVISSYGDVIGDVIRLFTQGAKYLTWGGVFDIALKVVKNASPWYKVAGLAFEFGSCLFFAGMS